MKDTKMSCKEFKKVLNDAGLNFDGYGYEGILAMISNYQASQYKEYSHDPEMVNVADGYRKACEVIWKALKQCGYFN